MESSRDLSRVANARQTRWEAPGSGCVAAHILRGQDGLQERIGFRSGALGELGHVFVAA
jgi:hypothetical protein